MSLEETTPRPPKRMGKRVARGIARKVWRATEVTESSGNPVTTTAAEGVSYNIRRDVPPAMDARARTKKTAAGRETAAPTRGNARGAALTRVGNKGRTSSWISPMAPTRPLSSAHVNKGAMSRNFNPAFSSFVSTPSFATYSRSYRTLKEAYLRQELLLVGDGQRLGNCFIWIRRMQRPRSHRRPHHR